MSDCSRVIVLGAGWSGLAAASTYLKINSNISLTILDSSDSPGGVWSKGRLYPGLLANSPSGLYEFTDLSMKGKDHESYDTISGDEVQDYLERYARFRGLYNKIRFGVHVVKVRRKGGLRMPNSGWELETSAGEILECDKLIVATGLHSKPNLPVIPQDSYTGVASIHSRELGKQHDSISSDPSVASVVVVGGCKSAIEACTIFLSAGKKVHWIVRPSEQGVPIVVLDDKAPFNLIAVNNTRLFSVWGPSIFDTTSWFYRFLHKNVSGVGVWLRDRFWKGMTKVVKKGPKYNLSENGRKIEPKGDDMFYDAPYIGVLHDSHPFLNWIHDENKVGVRRVKPVRLVAREMEVECDSETENGTTEERLERIPADAVVWCTGWQPSIDFFDPDEARHLGLSTPFTTETESNSAFSDEELRWTDLAATAEDEVCKTFPQLATSDPRPRSEQSQYTPFRLHRQIISPNLIAQQDRSITFCGLVSSSQTAVCSEIMSLWAVSWMEDLLPPDALSFPLSASKPPPSPSTSSMTSQDNSSSSRTPLNPSGKSSAPFDRETETLNHEIALVNAWMAHRYGYRSVREPAIIMEVQTYLDALVRDLGLPVYRKRSGASRNRSKALFWRWCPAWVREWVEPYDARDYGGFVEEFLEKQKKKNNVGKIEHGVVRG